MRNSEYEYSDFDKLYGRLEDSQALNMIYLREIQNLNEAMKRKNHANRVLRQRLQAERIKKNDTVTTADLHFLYPSENPDMGTSSK